MKILVLGWMHSQYPAGGIVQGLREMGHIVTTIASDPRDKSELKTTYVLSDFYGVHDLQLITNHQKQIKLKDIFFQLEANRFPELIIYIQDHYSWNLELFFTVPTIYYYTEYDAPIIPAGIKCKHIFYAFQGGDSRLQKAHPFETCLVPFTFLPYAVNEKLLIELKQWESRKTELGFMGSLEMHDTDSDPILRSMYNDRASLIQWAMINEKLFYRVPAPFETYIEFMNDVKYAINIGGISGVINQRIYESIGCGCLLLQYYDPFLETIGLIHRENCILFHDTQDLSAQIRWINRHPDKTKTIRDKGIQWFHSGDHTWTGRAKTMMQVI